VENAAKELGRASAVTVAKTSRHIPNQTIGDLTDRRRRCGVISSVHKEGESCCGDSSFTTRRLGILLVMVFASFLMKFRHAPDELRCHRLTHELLRNLLTRERRSSELRALADRCRLLN
jgi:hypothetical protein